MVCHFTICLKRARCSIYKYKNSPECSGLLSIALMLGLTRKHTEAQDAAFDNLFMRQRMVLPKRMVPVD